VADQDPPKDDDDADSSLKSRLESIVPDIFKKAMMSGLGALFITEETIRGAVSDMRLPKEAVGYVVQRAEDTRSQFLKLLAKELSEYFEKLDFSEEALKLLSSFTFEVTAQIRLVPNEDGGVTPEVTSKMGISPKKKKS
jgi:hypothetical protein